MEQAAKEQSGVDPRAFSADGYIVDQRRLAAARYGAHGSSYNGCGWIAAFNLLRALGRNAPAAEVLTGMHEGQWFGGALGTGPLRLRRYLARQGVKTRMTLRRRAALDLAEGLPAGVVMYFTGRGLHYVAFCREGASLRFFNAVAGQERCVLGMSEFVAAHVRGPCALFLFVIAY